MAASLPEQRNAELHKSKTLKMARSAHAYVRGNTAKFYEWLDGNPRSALPEGPSIWICGDCHVGNLGPVGNAVDDRADDGRISQGFPSDCRAQPHEPRPGAVHVALKEASRRTWRHLAQERIQGKTVRIPLGRRFWPITSQERAEIEALLLQPSMLALATQLRHRATDTPVQLLDVAYWKKGCSSLGKLRYAALLDVGGRATRGQDLCLVDIKEAVKAAAPRYDDAVMPREYAQRVVEGARQLSPHLGERMASARLGSSSIFVRELLPEDLKLEFAHVTPEEARRAARYLARVVGRAHARQLDDSERLAWKTELKRHRSRQLEAPSWLWNSVVDLVGTHEKGYLDHCRRFALESVRKIREVKAQPA